MDGDTLRLLSVVDDDMPEPPPEGWTASTYPIVAGYATLRFMMAEPIGVLEIAKMLGVKDRTVHQWLLRASVQLPKAQWPAVNGGRAWERKVILEWAGRTGRIRSPELAEEYRRVFKQEPAPPDQGGRRPGMRPQKKAQAG